MSKELPLSLIFQGRLDLNGAATICTTSRLDLAVLCYQLVSEKLAANPPPSISYREQSSAESNSTCLPPPKLNPIHLRPPNPSLWGVFRLALTMGVAG